MKSAFGCFQIALLLCGVFGADEDKVTSVSVMEGDPVTLNPDLTQIKTFNRIDWRFGDPVIAQTDGNDVSYPNPTEIFRDRLLLDQTGSLTIKNMKTKHSGRYELQISHGDGTTDRKYNVTVYESAADAGKSEMKSVSLQEGYPVTLQTNVTQLHRDELIVWRFGDEGKLLAKADIEAKSSPLYYDERFRDRLKLDQTGSLTITNTRTTDSGFYEVKISSSKQTLYKTFTVTVSGPGLSPGAVAGIVVVVGVLAAVAVAAAGVIYHRRKIAELTKQILTLTMIVKEGEDVTLKPNKDIKKDDVMLWMFGEVGQRTGIAQISGETGEITINAAAAGGRFSGRLELDKTTGSLTIKNSKPEHSGLYSLQITSSGGASEQRYFLTVNQNVEEISVEGGESVTLNPGTQIQGDNLILWMFGYQDDLIAQIRRGTREIYDGVGGRFKGRLELKETGSLTITNTTSEHTGLYKLQTISSSRILCKKFWVYINMRRVKVTEGDPVHLSTGLTKIERDDVIQWRFGDENDLISEIKGGTGKTSDERFRDELELNDQTGDLTILKSRLKHNGRYKLKIHSSKGDTYRTYSVIVAYQVTARPLMKENNGKRGNESAAVEMRSLMHD